MAIVGRVFRFAVLLVLLVLMFGGGWAVGRLGLGATVPVASLSDVERQFNERMRGSSLVGYFTVDGRTNARPKKTAMTSRVSRRSPTIGGGSTSACATATST